MDGGRPAGGLTFLRGGCHDNAEIIIICCISFWGSLSASHAGQNVRVFIMEMRQLSARSSQLLPGVANAAKTKDSRHEPRQEMRGRILCKRVLALN